MTARFRALLAALLLAPAPALTAQEAAGPDRAVALTFDDLPATHNTCDAAEVRRVTRLLTDALADRSLPAAGLVTPGRPCLSPALLAETLGRWVGIGATLGNHTATHPDLNATPVAEYLADLDRGQALLEGAVGGGERWFRAPMLHTGDEPGRKRALARHLDAGGYRVAPVTVDNQEWVYAAVYADARRRGEDALADRVVDAYLQHLEASMAYYERLSVALLGRELPQVLLLHANLLNAEALHRVVAMLEARGYRFIELAEAVSDPAYRRGDPYTGSRGISWLQRWALDAGVPVPPEPREADWVAEAFRAIP